MNSLHDLSKVELTTDATAGLCGKLAREEVEGSEAFGSGSGKGILRKSGNGGRSPTPWHCLPL